MDSLSELRRVRSMMSADADHDIRKLIEKINSTSDCDESRIINPGDDAEKCGTHKVRPASESEAASQ